MIAQRHRDVDAERCLLALILREPAVHFPAAQRAGLMAHHFASIDGCCVYAWVCRLWGPHDWPLILPTREAIADSLHRFHRRGMSLTYYHWFGAEGLFRALDRTNPDTDGATRYAERIISADNRSISEMTEDEP